MILHACKNDVEHLCECGLRRGLVDEVLARQVDVVTGPDGLQHGTFMDFYVLGGHSCQQSLHRRRREGRVLLHPHLKSQFIFNVNFLLISRV